MRTLILSLLLFSAASAYADAERAWAAGPLTASDFAVAPTDGNTVFTGELVQTIAPDAEGNLRVSVRAVTSPALSIGSPATLTPARLAYHQLQFDELEVLARKLQQELNSGMSSHGAEKRLAAYNAYYKQELEKLADATDNGRDATTLELYRRQAAQKLNDTPEAPMAVLEESDAGFGLYVGTGPHWTTGALADRFSWAWDFTFGIRAAYRRFRFAAQISYAAPTVKNPQLFTKPFTANDNLHANVNNANYISLGFSGGYAVVDTKRFTVEPFVGGMWTHYGWTAKPMQLDNEGQLIIVGQQQGMHLNDFNFWCGVHFQWHFNRAYWASPTLGAVRQELVSSVGLTPYLINGKYNTAVPGFGGWQIGLSLSYSGMVRSLKIR